MTSCTSPQNLCDHPLTGLLLERQFEKILLKHGWEKISNLEWLIVHRERRSFLSEYVDDINRAGKKQNIDPMWKVLNKDSDMGERTSFPWSWKLGVHSTTMWNKQRYCGQVQNHVRIANFRWGDRETTIPSKSSYFFMVLGHGWSCKEVCGMILWVGE